MYIVLCVAGANVETPSVTAASTHSSSDWALSKLYEINAILSAKSVFVIITAGKRRLLLSVSVSKVFVAFSCGSHCCVVQCYD